MALMRLRKRVAFERFLARLAASEEGGWVLKGALALELRLGLRTRMTKDINLGGADDEKAATKHLNAATGVDLGGFFSFEARRIPALDAATGFRAVRYTVRGDLAGRRFEQFPVDVAFSESSPIQVEPFRTANAPAHMSRCTHEASRQRAAQVERPAAAARTFSAGAR